MRSGSRHRTLATISCIVLFGACAGAPSRAVEPTTPLVEPSPALDTTVGTSVHATTSTSTTTTSTSTTSTTTTSTTTTSTTTTSIDTTTSTTTPTSAPAPFLTMTAAHAAFDQLALVNPAVTMTIVRDGHVVLSRASGSALDGTAATPNSPMVVASVGKLLTAALVARLDDAGFVDVDAPTPWALMGLVAHPAWNDVTPRELLTHTSGMPVVRRQWFERSGDCRSFLPSLIAEPPSAHRGRWTYSNGNYCALGLFVEAVTGTSLDVAAQTVLLDPVGATGVHLTTDGQRPGDVAYPLGVDRLARLGGAGVFLLSTDAVARVVAAITPRDREVMTWPGVMIDQYGWGHTGSVDGAVACVWSIDGQRTVVAATVAGGRPATGGEVCDLVVPAVAADLGVAAGPPDRSPP